MRGPSARERFEAAAAELGLDIDVRRFPQGTHTAAEAAAAVCCELGQLVFMALYFVGTVILGAIYGEVLGRRPHRRR